MSEAFKISQNEINLAAQLTGITPVYDDKYSRCLIFNDLKLPADWSKKITNLLLVKDKDHWTAFVDSDIEKVPVGLENLLSPFAKDGWCELVIDDVNSNRIDGIIGYLKNKLNFEFEVKKETQNNVQNLGVLRNIINYIDGKKLKIVYEYLGTPTIVTEEIYSIDNKIKKVLGVREIKEGWIFQDWDFLDNDNKTIENGFYFLKIRSIQDAGEIFQIIVLHKNLKDN